MAAVLEKFVPDRLGCLLGWFAYETTTERVTMGYPLDDATLVWARTLRHAPQRSDSLPVVRFNAAAGTLSWVAFLLDDGSEWVGAFGAGPLSQAQKVERCPDKKHAFVIARGQGYLLNVADRKLEMITQEERLTDVVIGPRHPWFVAVSSSHIYLYTARERIYRSKRSFDALVLDDCDEEIVQGRCLREGIWRAFALDINALQLTLGQHVVTTPRGY